MLRIFVTGANGFLGRATCEAFVQRGHHVIAGVRSPGKAQGVKCAEVFASGVSLFDPSAGRVLAGCDAVVHCAGWNGSSARYDSNAALTAESTLLTRQLCERAAACGVPHFVLLSSIKAVAAKTTGKALTEDAIPHPSDDYGRAKRAAEESVLSITGLSRTILRPPAIYGPGMTGGFATLFRLAARGVPVPIRGIANRRDFLALPSLADLLVRCVEAGGASNAGVRILHARDGSPISTANLYERMGRALDKRARIYTLPSTVLQLALSLPGHGSKAQSLLQSLEIDDTLSRQILQWEPSHTMDDVLRMTAKWISKS